jgi:GTP-binding protein
VTARRRLPSVVLVGRPNVGKSTLFNRLVGSRRAIVTPVPGTTRDVIEQQADWAGVAFRLVDTGGMFGASADPLHERVAAYGRKAIDAGEVLIFLVDGREGLVPPDEEIARLLHETGKPVVVAVNKIDDQRARDRVGEFYRLGFDPVIPISAEHGAGVADLLDQVVARLPRRPGGPSAGEGPESEGEIGVVLVGRPNVGKSSLLNRLLREERVMVDERPGTTRDAVDVVVRWHRRRFRVVDTAGIRRPGRVARAGPIEAVSVVVARRALARADVAILVLDATEGATDRDAAIAGAVERAGCGLILAVNKWDLVKGRGEDWIRSFDDGVREQLDFVDYAPLVHVSALTGERTPKLLELVDRVAAARRRRVGTAELNKLIEAVTAVHPPPSSGKRPLKLLYATQTDVAPPTFVVFTNSATRLHFSYERFLVNRLREAFGFEGSPIRLLVRRRR